MQKVGTMTEPGPDVVVLFFYSRPLPLQKNCVAPFNFAQAGMIHSASSSNTLRPRMDWVQDYEKTLSIVHSHRNWLWRPRKKTCNVSAAKGCRRSLMDWVGTMTRSLRGPVRSPCGALFSTSDALSSTFAIQAGKRKRTSARKL